MECSGGAALCGARKRREGSGWFGNNIRGIRHAAQHTLYGVLRAGVYHGIWSYASVPEYTSGRSKIELALRSRKRKKRKR